MALPQRRDHQELVKPLLEERGAWRCPKLWERGTLCVLESPVTLLGVGGLGVARPSLCQRAHLIALITSQCLLFVFFPPGADGVGPRDALKG